MAGLTWWSIVEPCTSSSRAATHKLNAKGGPSFVNKLLVLTYVHKAQMSSTAL